MQLRHLNISPVEADLFERLAGHLLFAGPALRPASEAIQRGAGAQSGLWPHAISGDLPILLLRIDDIGDIDFARRILLAHEYFCLKQLAVDLVILNEHAASYSQALQDSLEAVVRAQPTASARAGGRGAVCLLRTDIVPHPTAAPHRDPAATYIARHGRGYSRFERTANGIASSLLHYVPTDEPVKISRLQLRNTTNRSRSISVCAYVEWVLGAARDATAAFVQTEHDGETGALFARNPWSTAFGAQVAFIDFAGAQTSWTGDRRAFLGRNGTLAFPYPGIPAAHPGEWRPVHPRCAMVGAGHRHAR